MVRTFELTFGRAHELGPSSSLTEASATLPSGAYTTLRTYGGARVVRLAQHVSRLEDSARAQGLDPATLDLTLVRAGLAQVVQAAGHAESRLRLTFSPPRLYACVEPFEPPPEALYRDGCWCVTVGARRERPQAKDTSFLGTARAAYDSLPPGAHEGLMLGPEGAVLEGLSSNFFAVREGILHTEETRALPGVTRALVLELARTVLPLATTAVRHDQLREVSECFLSSVSRGILPVTRVDDLRVGDGKPGPFTRQLRSGFDQLMERSAEPLL
jgi:branched-chain amino acid aminotransferase